MARKPLGRNCTLAASTGSSTTTVTLSDVVDVTINDEAETATVDVRGQGYKTEAVTSKTFTIDFNLKAGINSTAMQLLMDAYGANADLYVKVTEPGGGRTIEDVMIVKTFGEGQPLGDFVEHTVTLAHANFDGAPTRSAV